MLGCLLQNWFYQHIVLLAAHQQAYMHNMLKAIQQQAYLAGSTMALGVVLTFDASVTWSTYGTCPLWL